MRSTIQIFVATVLLTVAVPAMAGKLSKCWTDKNGSVSCSDHVPPSANDLSRRDLDGDGIPRLELPAAPTQEEIEEQRQREHFRVEQQKQIEAQTAYDKRLRQRYPAIEDLLQHHESTIAGMDHAIAIDRDRVRMLQQRLRTQQARAADAERRGMQLSPTLAGELAETSRAIRDMETAIDRKRHDKDLKVAELGKELKRYRELLAHDATDATEQPMLPPAAMAPVVVFE